MSHPTDSPKAWKMRVLVVEDNEKTASAIAVILRAAGHEVEVATDGPAAVSAAETKFPDVVLLDIGLPGMDGWRVAEKLQALLGEKRPLLVAVSAYGREEDRLRSHQVGIDLHLTKPVDPDELHRMLARFHSVISPTTDLSSTSIDMPL